VSEAYDVRVTGRVQGVSFRWFVEQRAALRGVHGWVRNEPDGSVSAHLEGSAEALDGLVGDCRVGPPAARVARVEVAPAEVTGARGFEIR
jgi:acylphosphatase